MPLWHKSYPNEANEPRLPIGNKADTRLFEDKHIQPVQTRNYAALLLIGRNLPADN